MSVLDLDLDRSRNSFRGSSSRGESRVIRGGSWNNNARNVRCANRNQNDVDNQDNNLGFRLVRAHERIRMDRF